MLNALIDKFIIVIFICLIIALVFIFVKNPMKQLWQSIESSRKKKDIKKTIPKIPFVRSIKTEIAHGAVIEIRDDTTGEIWNHTMTDTKFTIGRDGSRHHNTVSLPNKSVSDRHLEITYHVDMDGPFYRIKNISALNPTEYLTTIEGKKRWILLQKGDEIDIDEGITSLYITDYKVIIKVPNYTHSVSSSDLTLDESNYFRDDSSKFQNEASTNHLDNNPVFCNTESGKTTLHSSDTYNGKTKSDFNPDDCIRSDRVMHVVDL